MIPITPNGFRKWSVSLNSEPCRNAAPTDTLNELRKLQRDRFAALEVQGEIYAYGKEVTFSKVLPIADLRTRNLNNTSAGLIAISLLATTEEAKLIAKTKPAPVGEGADYIKLSDEDLIRLGVAAGHLKL